MMLAEPEYLTEINLKLKEMQEAIRNIGSAVQSALLNRQKGTSASICAMSQTIHRIDEEITDKCVEALIRHQPFAGDLRNITVALKISYDLARVGRYLYNVTQIIDDVGGEDCEVGEISSMLEEARDMIDQSMNGYFKKDYALAENMTYRDDKIDERYRQVLSKYKEMKNVKGECIMLNALVARIVERMADHACYISNESLYLITGKRQTIRAPKCNER
uniref:PhoU domain-containing protein n=1 Tax=Candidatus Methanomethylicus mesodigestus TaxID=1867258 RepID=A0A7C3FAK1_9CREN